MTDSMPKANATLMANPELCTLDTCSIEQLGQLDYRPNLGGNAVLLGIFALGIITQAVLAFRYRTWGYLMAMVGACGLEIVGYLGRVMLYNNIFDSNNFIIYLVGCTIGPAFFSAGIYLCLSRIIVIYGQEACRIPPKMVVMFFIGFDVISLILQAAGGAMASIADTPEDSDRGVNVMIAGLVIQVVGTGIFTIVCGIIAFFISKNGQLLNANTYVLRQSKKFRFFLVAIGASTILILERCIYRAAELQEGFDGKLANDEPLFMILDGVAMALVIILLTVFHPALIMGQELWESAAFKKLGKGTKNPKEIALESFESV
jgi:hypothetical protein